MLLEARASNRLTSRNTPRRNGSAKVRLSERKRRVLSCIFLSANPTKKTKICLDISSLPHVDGKSGEANKIFPSGVIQVSTSRETLSTHAQCSRQAKRVSVRLLFLHEKAATCFFSKNHLVFISSNLFLKRRSFQTTT